MKKNSNGVIAILFLLKVNQTKCWKSSISFCDVIPSFKFFYILMKVLMKERAGDKKICEGIFLCG